MNSTTDPGPVVVGIDGSDNSQQALRWAVQYARRDARSVVALSAWELPVNYGRPGFYRSNDYTAVETYTRSGLATMIGEADLGDVQIGMRIVRGYPPSVLLAAAQHARLLVLGSGRYGRYARRIGSSALCRARGVPGRGGPAAAECALSSNTAVRNT